MIESKLKELRLRHGLTQQALATKLHVSVRCIKNWESDISDPSLANLGTLLDYFHVSADDFLGRAPLDIVSLACLSEQDRRRIKRALQAYIDETVNC